ncbi:MAG: hypothetical protein AAB899_04350, partial [Patescibacteria group bacterium]
VPEFAQPQHITKASMKSQSANDTNTTNGYEWPTDHWSAGQATRSADSPVDGANCLFVEIRRLAFICRLEHHVCI